jgi:UDP-N-acetyl-D-mannosaminuronic acid transferase (WecB/TagA/CpsF family)
MRFEFDLNRALEVTSKGGLLVAPSGPGLAYDLPRDQQYRDALANADVMLPDSGFMVLLWNGLHLFSPEKRIERLSGLKYLRALLAMPEVRAGRGSFWVMPTTADQERNVQWLRRNGFPHLTPEECYLAPHYRKVTFMGKGEPLPIADPELLALLERRRPRIVMLNIGGGVQEQLGWYLKKNLSYRPAIICTGAAIAFLSGGQTPIPPWADRYFLGWLLRILSAPKVYTKRYVQALALIPTVLRWKLEGRELR